MTNTGFSNEQIMKMLETPEVNIARAFKQFRIDKSGNLHPLFVHSYETIPVGEWILAKEGTRNKDGKVISKLGPLAYRPGWHLSEAPYAPHIGLKENGKVKYMRPDTVWAECEYYCLKDYTDEARLNGINGNRFNAQKACLDHIPTNGFYWFTTNHNAFGNWLIAERIKVLKVLSDAEVEDICWNKFGIHAQPRKVG